MFDILKLIDSPKDVKGMDKDKLGALAEELRQAILFRTSRLGGHVSPNLGVVELTIALHYVFDVDVDEIVWDVSHQSYAYKMLTGRASGFINEDDFASIGGYSSPSESKYDLFKVGHTSTSVSLLCGLVKARNMQGGKQNIIAVIGDGSLSGGEAYEGLNNLAEIGGNAIVIVNDNEACIAENHGGLYSNLKALRDSNGECPNNYFTSLGLDYMYIEAGNDIGVLIDKLQSIKGIDHPIVVHVHTIKGRGYSPAENDKEVWHWEPPYDINTGKRKGVQGENYSTVMKNYFLDAFAKDDKVVMVTSATPAVAGFDNARDRNRCEGHIVDVGIAEEHAVSMCAGLSKGGAKVFYPVYSSFVQRAYDQILQDVCINDLPMCFVVFAGSVFANNDITHLGIFDIPLLSNIPNLTYYAPTCKEELVAMLDFARTSNKHPMAIKVPGGKMIETGMVDNSDYNKINKFDLIKEGKNVAIIGVGTFYNLACDVVENLYSKGIDATLIKSKYVSGVDEEMLNVLTNNHKIFVTLEDGLLDGGFGSKVASYLAEKGVKVKSFGVRRSLPDEYDVQELLKDNNLTVPAIVVWIVNNF